MHAEEEAEGLARRLHPVRLALLDAARARAATRIPLYHTFLFDRR